MKRGFSLVELSIVLVILGLLVGGVLSGQSLIRASQLRSVVEQYNRYATATQSFRDKYGALPGDMPNAQNFWGIANATPATCAVTVGTGTLTCNGNGDNIIYPSAGSDELFRFWQHLANAGLIEGNYSGVDGAAAAAGVYSVASNSPPSRISPGLWFVYTWGLIAGNGVLFDGSYGNSFEIGTPSATADPNGSIFKPEEMWNIDTKLDDGLPGTGNVVARNWATCSTATASSQTSAIYAFGTSSVTCVGVFRNAF